MGKEEIVMLSPIGTLVNLNSASERELTQLPRIGVDRAKKIVHCRAIRRGFRDWDDLVACVGISETDVEAIRQKAWIGPFAETALADHARAQTVRGPVTARRPRKVGV